MTKEKVPYLCGGVLFVLLKQARKIPLSSREFREGVAVRPSDPRMIEDMTIALRPKDDVEDEKKYDDPAFKTTVSKYVNCIINAPKRLSFANPAFASSYEEMVKTQYSKAIEQMQKFVQGHVGPNSYKWLLEAVLFVVDKDTTISDSDQFYISPDGTPKSKEEIRNMYQFYLPAVLVGVMNYILLNRGMKNTEGASTLNTWEPQIAHRQRIYNLDSHICFDRKIEV